MAEFFLVATCQSISLMGMQGMFSTQAGMHKGTIFFKRSSRLAARRDICVDSGET